ncbi:MAG TPA: alkaline phosphatase family protein [Chthonomonadaceae bacterium]|nr:alkaline phosphatase family protein [Chthonomonadaceae bacterium]
MAKVVLFSIDGMRPDGLQQADTPFFDSLMASGAYTLQGRTVMPSVTLPCHTSLFLGVEPERHGITTNLWTPQVRPVPGIVETLHRAGKTAAFFTNWEPLRDLARPETLQASFFLNNDGVAEGAGDRELAGMAAAWLRDHPVDFAFVYFGHTDAAGHKHGWMSEPYLRAIGNASRCVATVCAALPEDAHILVTSDHGGHGKSHGTEMEEDMTTPLLLHGPTIPVAYHIERPVRITDIAPTIISLFGLDAPAEWMGTPITF